MKPTAKLRFIEREMEVNGDHKPVRILQQWWEASWYDLNSQVSNGEWRDVLLESESV